MLCSFAAVRHNHAIRRPVFEAVSVRGGEEWSAVAAWNAREVGPHRPGRMRCSPVAVPEIDRPLVLSRLESEEESPSMLDPETLERLLRHLETTDVDELEVVLGDARIYVRREPGERRASTPYPDPEAAGGDEGVAIIAPLTGIFYGRPSPEQPAFVSEGEAVEPGQVVALIETMKLFNEVTAEQHGEVIRIAAVDGDLVEAGQALVYVRPTEADEEG